MVSLNYPVKSYGYSDYTNIDTTLSEIAIQGESGNIHKDINRRDAALRLTSFAQGKRTQRKNEVIARSPSTRLRSLRVNSSDEAMPAITTEHGQDVPERAFFPKSKAQGECPG